MPSVGPPDLVSLPRRGQAPPSGWGTPWTPGGVGAPADLPGRLLVHYPPGLLGTRNPDLEWAGPSTAPVRRRHGTVADWSVPWSGGTLPVVSGRFAHGTLTFLRRFFANTAGAHAYGPGTGQESWAANAMRQAPGPTAAVPFSNKRIVQTLNRSFGADRQLFQAYPPEMIQRPLPAQWQRAAASPKMHAGWFNLLTVYGRAPSFGSRTVTLPTTPSAPTAAMGGAY